MTVCDQRGVLVRSGTAQSDRDPAERDPGHVRLDDRDVADLMLFARRFARHLKYYAPDNTVAGDWQAWFDRDNSTILASLARLPIDAFRQALADIRTFLEDDPGRDPAELATHFTALFHLPLVLFREMAGRQALVAPDDPLGSILDRLVGAEIAGPLGELSGYFKGAEALALVSADPLDPAAFDLAGQPGPGPRLADQVVGLLFTGEGFGAMTLPGRVVAGFAHDGWSDFHDDQDAIEGPYADATDAYGRIFDALNHNLLVGAVERLFRAMGRARAEAETRLRQSLTDFAGHTPHYALWLAFLSMFDRVRVELNEVPGRHLDFYYEEILRLARRDPVPDHAGVTFRLAKGHEAHLIPAGTGLRAGKDATGAPVTYATDEDLVVNRAEVAALKGVRIESWTAGGQLHAALRAAPVLNSRFGLGEEDLPEDAPHFPPFGPPAAPYGRMGFAIADRQLFLREGQRTLTATVTFDAPLAGGTAPVGGLMVRLTAEKEWLELPAGDSRVKTALSGRALTVTVTLDGAAPPIVPHDPEVHEGPYPSAAPVMEVLFDFDGQLTASTRSFARMRDATVERVTVRSRAEGLRLMSIRTAEGVADPSDSFLPFGAQPRKGARWIIGSSELFAKSQQQIEINVTWAEAYNKENFFLRRPASAYSVDFEFLNAGGWTAFAEVKAGQHGASIKKSSAVKDDPITLDGFPSLFSSFFYKTLSSDLGIEATEATIQVDNPALAASDAALVMEEPHYGAASITGFMRITLKEDFGHDRYIDVKTMKLIEAAKPPASPSGLKNPIYNFAATGLPEPPYTPEIEEISISYVAQPRDVAHVWQVHPFGVASRDADGPLLDPTPFEGAMYVGVAALDPPERLSLLMQVADGTGDSLLEAPALTVEYLADDAWVPFARRDVDDRTAGLAGSGVLSLAMSRAADPAETAMPAALHWVRIAAPEHAAAVNALLGVHAQAVRATLVAAGTDPAFLDTPLAADTITKLNVPDPAIKAVAQPYPSFGGRGPETRRVFHRRASERLRHKDRAVTLWDYEHLSLEAFPDLYRVKALNTTELVRQGGKVVADNELSPGALTVVAVPFTEGRAHLDPLRPYATRATLTELHDHLRRRQSPFVRFEVANPKFEEIHVAMKVAFRPGIADLDFYRDRLEAALIDHLTPWRRAGAPGLELGGRLYKSTVIDAVEELDYVDFLQEVRMYHRPDPDTPAWTKVDTEIARATTARSVLVSAPAHDIAVLT